MNTLKILAVFLFSLALATPLVQARTQHAAFHALLLGSSQIPSVNTNSHGVFIARLSHDGNSLTFKLIVTNLENVTVSHIHLGDSKTNGPPIVFLFHTDTPIARQNGILSQGTITSSDLIGPLKGMTLNDLLNAINSGNAYVNVHTTQHPGGEIRGQITAA